MLAEIVGHFNSSGMIKAPVLNYCDVSFWKSCYDSIGVNTFTTIASQAIVNPMDTHHNLIHILLTYILISMSTDSQLCMLEAVRSINCTKLVISYSTVSNHIASETVYSLYLHSLDVIITRFVLIDTCSYSRSYTCTVIILCGTMLRTLYLLIQINNVVSISCLMHKLATYSHQVASLKLCSKSNVMTKSVTLQYYQLPSTVSTGWQIFYITTFITQGS